MATPVFKFQHPELPNEDLYFIQNTFFELPATLPMDLTSFLWYHYEKETTLEGFIYGWQNLNQHQTTLDGFEFETHFNEIEKQELYKDTRFANALETALTHQNISHQLKLMLDKIPTEKEVFDYLISNSNFSFNFYNCVSRHYLMEYLWDHYQEQLDDKDSYKKDKKIIRKLVEISGLGLSFADPSLLLDVELLANAIENDERAWFYVSNHIKETVQIFIDSKSFDNEDNNDHLPF
jgi:hypothetical protein